MAQSGQAAQLLADPLDGRAKMWVIWRLLQLRRELPELFSAGGYGALAATGSAAGHVVAFRRAHGKHVLIVASGRLFAKLLGAAGKLPLGDAWGDTRLTIPDLAVGTVLSDVLSGTRVTLEGGGLPLARLFSALPAAALVADVGR